MDQQNGVNDWTCREMCRPSPDEMQEGPDDSAVATAAESLPAPGGIPQARDRSATMLLISQAGNPFRED
jgi:hypothetical protein